MMAAGSFSVRIPFVQNREDALRHVGLLAKGLKKVAWAGIIGGAGCGAIALLLRNFLMTPAPPSSAMPGARELSGISFVAWFMTIALMVFGILYLIAGWGLSRQKPWARYTAAAVFLLKVLLCVWLGRGSVGAMIVFLTVAGWDLYGLWVLLAKETGLLFTAPSSLHRQPAKSVPNLLT
jgi:hypothetical protein